MPQVPVYGDRQVRLAPLQPVAQATPDVSSGAQALAQGMGQVAEAVDRIDLRDAQARANDIDTRLTRDWIKWEDENRGKFTNQSAAGYTQAVDDWWKQAATTYGANLDGRSRALVGQTLARRQAVALDQAGRYEFAEKEKYADSTTAGAINTATVNALKTGDYAGEAQRIRQLVDEQGARKNWSKEQRDAERNVRMGAFNAAVVTQLAERSAADAQKYLTEAIERGEIRPEQQPRLELIVKGEADNQFARQEAVRLMTLPPEQRNAELAKITDPARLEKTQTALKVAVGMQREGQREVEERASDQAWQLFSQNKAVPEAVLATMNGRERAQLVEAQRVRAERLAAPKGPAPVRTDMATYIDVREKLARGERVDLRAYTETIGPAQMEQLLDIQGAVRAGGARQDSMLTDEQRINAALIGLGIDKKKDPETATRLTTEIDRRVRAASAGRDNRPLTPDEKQAIVDRVAMDKVYVEEWGIDPQKPVALLTPAQQAKAYVVVNGRNVPVSSVPASFRERAIALGTRRGFPVSEQLIVEDYLAKQAETGGRASSGTIR